MVVWDCVVLCFVPRCTLPASDGVQVMAVYGLDIRTGAARNGFINAIVQPNASPVQSFVSWSPTLGPNTTGPASAGVPAVQINGVLSADDALSKAFRRNGPTIEAFRQLLIYVLNGNANVGTQTYAQIKGTNADQGFGGKRPIDVITTLNNRVVTVPDKQALQAIFARSNKPATYVTDPSRNGGGGKGAW